MVMSAKMKLFCEEYIVDVNATKAAIRAGYSDKSAKVTASKLMKRQDIRDYIDQLLEERQKPTIAKAEEVMEFLTATMRGEELEYKNTYTKVEDEIEIEYSKVGKGTAKIEDRLRAAELIGKRYGMFTDKVQATVEEAVTFIDDIEEELENEDS